MLSSRFLPLAALLLCATILGALSSPIEPRQHGCAKCPDGKFETSVTYHGDGKCSVNCETRWERFKAVTATCANGIQVVTAVSIAIAAAMRQIEGQARGVEGGWNRNQRRGMQDFNMTEFERLGGINDDVFAQYLSGNSSYTSGANMWVLAEMGMLGEPTIQLSDNATITVYQDNGVVVTTQQASEGDGLTRRSEEGDSVWINTWRNDIDGGQAKAPWLTDYMADALARDIVNHYTTGVHDHVSNICDCIYTETGKHNLATGLEFSAYRKGGKPSHLNCPDCSLRSHNEL